MIEGIISFWFIFVALSLIFTVYDIRNTPVSWVQKLGWILVVMYSGPFGLFFYLLACRSPGHGMHAIYTQAQWKQAINSEVHCLAGDATGIIFAAILLSFTSLPGMVELIIEYIAGFICGWVIFQAGMMRSMYNSYYDSLTKTFFAEAASMNCVMIGMIPTMVLLGHVIPHCHDPATLHFWFVMGIATIIGGITAYPINAWLIKNKLKHGCMTLDEIPIPAVLKESSHKMKMNLPHDDAHQEKSDVHTLHEMKTLPWKQQKKIMLYTFLIMLIAAGASLVLASLIT